MSKHRSYKTERDNTPKENGLTKADFYSLESNIKTTILEFKKSVSIILAGTMLATNLYTEDNESMGYVDLGNNMIQAQMLSLTNDIDKVFNAHKGKSGL